MKGSISQLWTFDFGELDYVSAGAMKHVSEVDSGGWLLSPPCSCFCLSLKVGPLHKYQPQNRHHPLINRGDPN